ncbi:MAG: hypothetical protein CSB22_00185 [Deltaproteobacteria bacterium]|nr:MAG: hypothetical protein CSB22_00185 [Deltaproteobacteria bacterium]
MKSRKGIIKLVLFTMVVSLFAGIAIAAEDHTEITGVIEQTDTGFVIKTHDGDVAAEGADLATMVGKTVKATGQVTEGDAGKVFNVMSIEEVQEEMKKEVKE